MSVTIKRIAAEAGVSRGTVDRVLHNRPGVNPDVAAHVRQIADELGFLPNRAGKILAARKQPLKIGCFLPGVGNAFFDDVIAGFCRAEKELSDFGVSVEVVTTEGYDVKTHIKAIGGLLDAGCDALCVSTVDVPETRGYINAAVENGIPVITVNTDLSDTKRLCYVGCDYLRGGSTAAGLLAMTAPQSIELLIITGSLNIKGHNDRIRGFSQTLRHKNTPYRIVDVFESLDNDDHAYKTTLEVLDAHPEINCVYIVAAGASGVCRALSKLERRDIHVVTHDETAATRSLVLDGTIDFTIGQEPEAQGYMSIQLMFEYFIGNRQTPPADYITATVIRIRENMFDAPYI